MTGMADALRSNLAEPKASPDLIRGGERQAKWWRQSPAKPARSSRAKSRGAEVDEPDLIGAK